MCNQIDISPLLVSLLERAPKQSKQIFEPILLQRILASQNLCIMKISVIWNSEQCGSEVFVKKGVNIFALAGLLASLNPRLASLRIYRPFKTQWFCVKVFAKREVKTYFEFTSAFYLLLTFIMFFLRDAFSLCHGFQITHQCGGLKYFKRCFPVLDRSWPYWGQTGYINNSLHLALKYAQMLSASKSEHFCKSKAQEKLWTSRNR